MSNFGSVLNSLIENINNGVGISASDTITSLLGSISTATSEDRDTFNNLLSTITTKIETGQYDSRQLGEASKNLVNSLHSELSSGKYSSEQIGEVARKVFSSNPNINSKIDSLSSEDLGKSIKDYVKQLRSSITSENSREVGEKIKSNISSYSNKIKNNTLTLDDIKYSTSNGSGVHLSFEKTKTTKKKKGKGTAVAKATKKTTKKVKKTTKGKTKTNSVKLKETLITPKTTTTDTTVKNISKVTTSLTETIYYDHDKARVNADVLQDCFEALNRDNKELQSVINDLNNFWRGSLATKFTNQFEDYINKINKYSECLQDGYDNLKNGSKAYNTFDNYFATKEI